MNEADALDIVQAAVWAVLLGAGPAVIVAMIVGLVIALLQALTSGAGNHTDIRTEDRCHHGNDCRHSTVHRFSDRNFHQSGFFPHSIRVLNSKSNWFSSRVSDAASCFVKVFIFSALAKQS